MATVTIAKSHLDALLRRAEFHTDAFIDAAPLSYGITISQAEYSHLTKQSREYMILRAALLRGGLNGNTLDILIAGAEREEVEDGSTLGSTWQNNTFGHHVKNPVNTTWQDQLTPESPEHKGASNDFPTEHRGHNQRSYSSGAADTSLSLPDRYDSFVPGTAQAYGSGFNAPFPSYDQRTLYFTNLPDKIAYADLANIIRGGRLLELHIRNDRTATASFVEGAADFLSYAKRRDLYVRTKRLQVKWNDRQFRLPGHVANKIDMGATRNLVIRNGTSKNLTEEGIRDDLEHIHNLVVISITIDKGDIFVSTNSIHNALFARTCMMSRSLYKGLNIEWYPDGCAAPIPKLPERGQAPIHSTPAKSALRKTLQTDNNLFSLLDMDEGQTDDSDKGSKDDNSQAVPDYTSGVKINWADAAIEA